MKKLLITDLDNTLVDWVDYFTKSLEAMIAVLVEKTGIAESTIVSDFKEIHQLHGNTEHPWAVLELPSLIAHFGTSDKDKLKVFVADASAAFNDARALGLTCYDGVLSTLESFKEKGVKVVIYTDAPARNAMFKLESLGIKHLFDRVYAIKERFNDDLDDRSKSWVAGWGDYVHFIDHDDKKPNPCQLKAICDKEGVSTSDAIYIGDSMVKDIAMANIAGVTSVFAGYGMSQSPLMDLLIGVTGWTDEVVKRESDLKLIHKGAAPDHVAKSFCDLTRLV